MDPREKYRKSAALLLDVLPAVVEEDCFALYGGSAINYFALDMPRYSVDLDLRYMPIEGWDATQTSIAAALARIEARVERMLPGIQIDSAREEGKTYVVRDGLAAKVEPNTTNRGLLFEPRPMRLCPRAQAEFGLPPLEMLIVSEAEMYGGKVSAALQRQHPRDLFDVSILLAGKGITREIITGLLLAAASGQGNVDVTFNPRYHDRHRQLENEFQGMSALPFTHEDHTRTLQSLVQAVHGALTTADREFLLSLVEVAPKWDLHDFARFPSVQRRQQNLRHFKGNHPEKYQQLLARTKEALAATHLHTPPLL